MPTLTDAVDATIHRLPFAHFYDLWAVAVRADSDISDSVRQAAEATYPLIQQVTGYSSRYEHSKFEYWCQVVAACVPAAFHRGCIRVARDTHKTPEKFLRVIDCAVKAGLLHPRVSKPGFAPKESRYIPTDKLRSFMSLNPRELIVDPGTYVGRYSRRTDEQMPVELDFDINDPFPADVQRRLELINKVNLRHSFSAIVEDPYDRRRTFVKLLNPIHVARFTEHWDWHGRMYTGADGHQNLRKIERATIQIANEDCVASARLGEPCCELDYGGLHTRMLYNLRGLECPDDPYALWPVTSPAARAIAKQIMNSTINAKTLAAAVAASNDKVCEWTRDKHGHPVMKSGKDLEDARKLAKARDESGLTFKEVQMLALQQHDAIRDDFGKDKGMELMRLDSAIALDVMSYFAEQGIPILGVHDSLIVARQHRDKLFWAMDFFYRKNVGNFEPVIKESENTRRLMAA